MDDRLGELNQHIYRIGDEVEELTSVVSDMSEYCYPITTSITPAMMEPNILMFLTFRLGVQPGVNFMSNPQTYFTAPVDMFTLFGNPGDMPSTSSQNGNAIDEE
ncbi:hypothetical protein Tco_0026648 [Tanacetum coccineum]